MKINSFLFPLLLLLLKTSYVRSQDTTLFNLVMPPGGTHYGSKAGIQDLQGYMWFGTYQAPLRRFDGYHYTFYSNDPLDSNSLAQNWVEALWAGSDGTIWIGTASHGLDHLDPATGHITHFRHKPNDSNSLSDDRITTILEDSEGIVWIGTLKGLNKYDPKTHFFQRFYNFHDNPNSLSCNEVMKIYEDRRGTIWIGTGSIWTDQGGQTDCGGLNRFDKKTGKFTRYLHERTNPHSLINNKVKAIFEDSRGTFWVGTAGDGLHTMDREKGTFERHLYDPEHPEKLSRPPQKQIRSFAIDHITFMIEDVTGTVWIGTFGNGLSRYDPKTNKVKHYPLFKDAVSGMQLEVPWWACTSRDGMLWIGYFRGLYRIDPLQKNIPYFAIATPVGEICEDKFGALWYGTEDQGVVRKDIVTGSEQHFVHNPNNRNSISNNRIQAVYEDRHGELWIGTSKGLDRFERTTETFSHFRFHSQRDDSLINEQGVGSVYEDRRGAFWLGVHQGLIRVDRKLHTIIEQYKHSSEDTSTLDAGEVILIYEDNRGDLWLSTFGGTLNRLSVQTGKIQRFLRGVNIHSLWQDAEGILWVGTSIGLYRSNSELNNFARFNGPNGELDENMIVNGVLEDNQRNLWLNASSGICQLNQKRDKLLIFGRHGDPTWYNGTGYSKGKTGALFFGGGSGYFIFFPEDLAFNTTAPQIVLSAFRLSDELIMPGTEGPLKEPLSKAKEIMLNYNQNVFSFDFAGIHYGDPQHNPHFFMLQGLDKEWRKAGEEKTAYYTNVPPGKYVFRVKAANSDGVWAEKSIAIIIAPPWWQTWWAYISYTLLFLIVLGSFIKWRERALQNEKLLLEEKVVVRTRELKAEKEKVESTLTQLEAVQAQLVETEKINERLRISRELHDDIGGTLSGIVLYSHLAETQIHSPTEGEVRNTLNIIQQSANEMVNKLNDIVWSVNPEYNSLKELLEKLEEYATEMTTAKNIKVRVDIPETFYVLQLPVETRHNIYLICKEAINNAVKYSNADVLELSAHQFDHSVEVTIKDNGEGFDIALVGNGNGLRNMQKRADKINGKLCIQSAPHQGTIISLRCLIEMQQHKII